VSLIQQNLRFATAKLQKKIDIRKKNNKKNAKILHFARKRERFVNVEGRIMNYESVLVVFVQTCLFVRVLRVRTKLQEP
jgi:hypothetical protein